MKREDMFFQKKPLCFIVPDVIQLQSSCASCPHKLSFTECHVGTKTPKKFRLLAPQQAYNAKFTQEFLFKINNYTKPLDLLSCNKAFHMASQFAFTS